MTITIYLFPLGGRVGVIRYVDRMINLTLLYEIRWLEEEIKYL